MMRIPDLIESLDRPFVSIELLPPRQGAEQGAFWQTVERLGSMKPLFAAVTCGAGGKGAVGTLATSRDLAEKHGFTVMPHVTCVHSTASELTTQIAEIRSCGIRNVLAVRGDFPSGMTKMPSGLKHASDLVEHIQKAAPDMSVGVAAYPDGHPESRSIKEDIGFLKYKLDSGAAFGVTQLFFDNRRYFDMMDRLEAMGCSKPVIPSVLPIRSIGQIKRVMELCDAPVPGNILSNIESAHDAGGDAAVREYGVRLAGKQLADLIDNGAPGVHVYPFNQSELCLDAVRHAGLLP